MSKTTQRAAYFREFAPVGTVVPIVDDAPIPEPIPGFLLVRNLAASINPVDKYISAGYFAERGELFAANRAVGSDFAGVVVGVGEGAEVTELDGSKRPAIVGDVVFGDGIAGSGTVSEYANVLAAQAVIKPAEISFAAAAALPLAGLTALQTFEKHVAKPVGEGSKVLVLGGSGGVGSLAIQIAKALGAATVAATSSNTDLLKELGADIAIDYHNADWSEQLAGENYDVVFATVADTDAAERALKVLGPEGSFIYTLQQAGLKDKENPEVGGRKYAFMFTDSKDAQSTAKLGRWAADGTIRAVFSNGKTFPFTQEGWEALSAEANSGRAKGKLVIKLA